MIGGKLANTCHLFLLRNESFFAAHLTQGWYTQL
jgi:hypothetical protein